MTSQLSMEQVNQVKQRHEERLMNLPQVVGVSVGMSANGNGDADGRIVIKVFVSSTNAASDIPGELEGVPVEVEETGEFRAL